MENDNGHTVHLCRVPDYILLKQADKRISFLEMELGKEKAYIEELEAQNKRLNSQISMLKNNNSNLLHQLKTDERVIDLRQRLHDVERKYHETSRLYAQLKYKYDMQHEV